MKITAYRYTESAEATPLPLAHKLLQRLAVGRHQAKPKSSGNDYFADVEVPVAVCPHVMRSEEVSFRAGIVASSPPFQQARPCR